jgi:hypothetical protein
MRNRFWTILPFLCIWICSCNFPSRTTPGPATPSAESAETIRPTSARTETSAPPTSTATPSIASTAGPIARLPAGTALAISYIDMIDAGNGWSIGGAADELFQSNVFQTGDGGSTWKDVTPPEKTVADPAAGNIAVGGFWDINTAWVTYYSANLLLPPTAPVVWITADGGTTWRASSPLDLSGWTGEYRVSDVFFINSQTGWVLVHKGDDPQSDKIALFQTVNGGSTWERMINPAANTDIQECEKTGILFTGPWNGWMTGDCHGDRPGVFLYQTFDGGKNWIEAKLPSPPAPPGMLTTPDFSCRIHPPAFFAQQTQLVLGVECVSTTASKNGAYIYSSSLDGSAWHYLVYPGGRLVIRSAGDGRVFRGDVGSGLAVGKELYIYDGQAGTWEKLNSIDWTGQFDFIDWNKGWAAARRGDTPLLMYTSDGARNWKALTPVAA